MSNEVKYYYKKDSMWNCWPQETRQNIIPRLNLSSSKQLKQLPAQSWVWFFFVGALLWSKHCSTDAKWPFSGRELRLALLCASRTRLAEGAEIRIALNSLGNESRISNHTRKEFKAELERVDASSYLHSSCSNLLFSKYLITVNWVQKWLKIHSQH